MCINHNFTGTIHLHNITERCAIGSQADLYKDSIQLYQTLFLRLTVFYTKSRQLITVSNNFNRLRTYKNLDIGKAFCFFLQNAISFQLIHKFKNRHFRTDSGKIDSCFYTGISTTHYRNMFSFIERAVTMGTESNPFADIVSFSRNIQFTPTRPRSNDESRSGKLFADRGSYHLFFPDDFD